MKKYWISLVVIILLIPFTADAYDMFGRVIWVFDGDSFTILNDDEKREVRLAGVDSPEKGQPYSNRARQALQRLIKGEIVRVDVDKLDGYGRYVGTVYVGDLNVGREMVRQGLAWWYRYYASDDKILERLEREARNNRVGLWRDENPIPPWTWRRNHRS